MGLKNDCAFVSVIFEPDAIVLSAAESDKSDALKRVEQAEQALFSDVKEILDNPERHLALMAEYQTAFDEAMQEVIHRRIDV